MLPHHLTFDYVISVGEEEHVCRITGTYAPAERARLWCDHPEPGCDASFEVEKVEAPVALRQFGKLTGEFRYIDIIDLCSADLIAELSEHGVMEAGDDAIAAAEYRSEQIAERISEAAE